MITLTHRNFSFFFLFYSAIALLSAFLAEKFWNIPPCLLCIYTRYIFLGIFLLSLSYFLFHFFFIQISQWGFVIMLFSLSVYQAGVEYHFWKGPPSCTSMEINDIQERSPKERMRYLKNKIKQRPIVPCNQIKWKFLGFSVTFWNMVVLFIILSLGLKGLWKEHCCKK